MTDRRSMQSDAARSSRAFQFVPGHVGGRVASAQPVRRRQTIGLVQPPPPPPPETILATVVTGSTPVSGGVTFGPTAGETRPVVSATGSLGFDDCKFVALLISQQASLAYTMPTGWTSLGSGSMSGNSYRWALWSATSASATWTMPATSPTSATRVVTYAFRGLSAGSFSLETVSTDTGRPMGVTLSTPATGSVRLQIVAAIGVYIGFFPPIPEHFPLFGSSYFTPQVRNYPATSATSWNTLDSAAIYDAGAYGMNGYYDSASAVSVNLTHG